LKETSKLLQLSRTLITAFRMTYHVTYHVRPYQPIIDQQGPGLRGLIHKESHPVIPDLHKHLFKGNYARCIHRTLIQRIPPINNPIRKNTVQYALCT